MKHLQLSLAAVMAAVVYLAISFSALKSPTRLWANTMFSLAIAAIAVAILGAIYRRAFWIGFLVAGGGYMALVLTPWGDERVASRLVSTELILRSLNSLQYSPQEVGERVWWWSNEEFEAGRVNEIDDQTQPITYEVRMGDGRRFPVHASRFRPIDPASYQTLGHSVVCPVFGILGGIIASHFARGKSGLRRSVVDKLTLNSQSVT